MNDKLFPLALAPELIRQHLIEDTFSEQQIYTWHSRGCGGKKLKARKIAGKLYTSLVWLREFFDLPSMPAEKPIVKSQSEAAKELILSRRNKR